MNAELALATAEDSPTIVNLWPLYQYDLSELGGQLPNAHGLFEDDNIHAYDYSQPLRVWFNRPNHLFPYIIRVDGRAAGLAMIGKGPAHAPKGADYFVHEFFVLRPFRRHGIAAEMVRQIFAQHPGKWELWVIPENAPALAFWRKVIGEVAGGAFTETQEYKASWESEAVVLKFENI